MGSSLTGESSIGTRDKPAVWFSDQLSVFDPVFISAVELRYQNILQAFQGVGMIRRIGQIGFLQRIFREIK